MAIGAHELLLIVRAQNQASGLLSRVGRDFRRLQNMRALDVQRSQQVNRLARNALQQQTQMAKIQSIMSSQGKVRLQHEQAVARVYAQQTNIQNRINSLEIRRSAIARAESNLEVQRLRIQKQQLGVESSLADIETRRIALNNRLGVIGTQMMRIQARQGALDPKTGARSLGLQAQLLERQLAAQKAQSAYMKSVSAGGAVKGSEVDVRRQIAQLRLDQTKAQIAGLAGEQKILQSTMQTLRGSIIENQAAFDKLAIVERNLAKDSEILTERQRALQYQLQNLDARSAAVAATEAELNTQLALTNKELEIVNARWAEQQVILEGAITQRATLIEEEKVLDAQLAQTDALMAGQNADRWQTALRGVSHIGRVLTSVGLIGVAAFGAMGIAAAHFNSEAVNVATQTGNINQSAQAVVNNSAKVQKVIIDTMQTIPANSHQLTDALYNIYSSMNVTFGGGAKLLKLFGQVWVAGGMRGSIEDVSNALITLANNWQISGNDMAGFQKLAASTLATVRFGRLTVEQYTQTMNQLAPAFHGAHQSIEQMNGALAFLTRVLPGTGVTAAGIARMMEQLQRFAAAPKAGFEALAKEITDSSGNLKPLDQVLQILITRMPQLAKSGISLTNFFKTVSGNQGTVQARRALQAFMLLFPQYQDVLKQTTTDQGEFKRSLKAMEASTGVKWAQFTTQMKALGLEIGATVVPALLAAAKPLQSLAHWWHNLSDEQRKSYGQILGWVAVATLALGVIMSISGGLALFIISLRTMSEVLRPLVTTLGKNATALKGLGSEAGAVDIGMLKVLGSVGLIITAFILLEKVTHSTTKSFELLGTGLSLFMLRNLPGRLMAASKGAEGMSAAMVMARTPTLLEVAAVILLASELQKMLNKIHGWKEFTDWLDKKTGITKTNSALVTTQDQLINVRKELDQPLKKNSWYSSLIGIHAPQGLGFQAFPVNISKRLLRQDTGDITAIYRQWRDAIGGGRGVVPQEFAFAKIHNLFPELDPEQINAALAAAKKQYEKGFKDVQDVGFAQREGIPTGRAVISRATQFTTSEFLASVRQAAKLQQIQSQAPNLEAAYTAWKNYHTFVDTVTADMTKGQKAMFNDLVAYLQQITQSFKLVSPAALAAANHVEALRQSAVKSKNDLTKWQAYFKAQNIFNKKYTSDQVSQANEIINAQQSTANATTDVSKITTAAAIEMAKRLNQLNNIATKTGTTKAWEAFYNLQKHFADLTSQDQADLVNSIVQSQLDLTKTQTQIAKDRAAKLKAIEDKAAADRKQSMKTAQDNLKTSASALTQIYTTALQTYQSQLGTIFNGPFMQSAIMQNRQQFGFSARPQDLLRDMFLSVQHFSRFQNTIGRLRKRGAPAEMIAQIQQLGPEAQKQLDSLLRLAPGDFKKYVTLFQRGQAEAQKLAKADMDRQLKAWLKFGKSVALAIMLGIQSETPGLQKAVIARIKALFPGLAAKAEGRATPAQLAATGYGAREGIPTWGMSAGNRRTQSAGTVNNVTYNVHPTHRGEGLESMLRRTHFYYRNRRNNL